MCIRDSLRAAPDIMAALFAHPGYAPHLERVGRRQTIMIGYSDSNKDAGYLAANWAVSYTHLDVYKRQG